MTQDDERDGWPLRVNRAPVLTLWAAVVVERLGLDWDQALTFGRGLAGVTAHAKGVRLGIFEPSPERMSAERERLGHGQEIHLRLMGRVIPAVRTPEGLRAVARGKPIAPKSVARYLESKFGERPAVKPGAEGWGAEGELDPRRIAELAGRR